MTDADIMTEIGKASLERKRCLDRISCYEKRLGSAKIALVQITNKDYNPCNNEENPFILSLESDPREDAKNYIDALKELDRLAAFLRKHNAL